MKAFIIIFFLLFFFEQKAQTVFWTETYNNGCASGCVANGVNTGNGVWSVVSLAGDANPLVGDLPNQWYISCAENGHTNTVCGSGCVAASAPNTVASLHISSTSSGDIGAAYDAGGLCGIFWCTNTHKKVISPLISTAGKSGISIAFDYIEFGDAALDDMYAVEYSTNGGTTWTTISNPAKTTCCGGACSGFLQGRWTAFTSATLPAAANNIANFRIAFTWINNDDGIGTDPSFAVDNLKVRNLTVLPIELLHFKGEEENNKVEITWTTASEKNSNYFEVQKSTNGIEFITLGKMNAAGHSSALKKYSFNDTEVLSETGYYRLKMVDIDNSFQYSEIIVVEPDIVFFKNGNAYSNNANIIIDKNFILKNNFETLSIVNTSGKTLKNYSCKELATIQEEKITLPQTDLEPGMYVVLIKGATDQKSFKFFISQ